MPLYLCLDQGGHASRALVLDEQGVVVARATRALATELPAPDRVEQEPRAVAASLVDAARDAVAALGPRARELVAAGLATQRSSIACWDRVTGAALTPIISWQDRRAHEWLTQFASHETDIEQRTGLRLSAHYGASKLRWCLDHVEAVRAAQREQRLAAGPLASFLAFHLTEQRPLIADPSNAQRTLLWNLATRDWDASLLDLFGVPRNVLPACTATCAAFGALRVGEHTLPLTVVTGDQAAALFAFGAPRDDVAYINLGTGAFVQRATSEARHIDGLLNGIAFQDGNRAVFTVEGTVNGAGAALGWAKDALNLPELDTQLSGWLSCNEELPLFLNGVGGLGAPYWRADFSSCFVGDGTAWQKAAAVAESIVFLLAVNLERMQAATGPLRSLVLTGGLAECDGLCQRLADLTGLPAWRAQEHEATARGLAWLLAGRPAQWADIAGTQFMPIAHPALHERYARWRTVVEARLQ